MIKNVSIVNDSGVLRSTISHELGGKELQFAFYVFKNGKRISVSWYSDSNFIVFDTKGSPGYYQVYGFVKDVEGVTFSKSSTPIFCYPRLIKEKINSRLDLADAMVFSSGGWDVPFLYYPSEEKFLFVLMPSAVDRSDQVMPVFNRFTWAGKGVFKGCVLCVADPTLELDERLSLGWCLGSRQSDLSEILAKLVKQVATVLDIPTRNIVFWGSSAGGFSALALSARVGGSTAVAINAQTDALAYADKNQVALIKEVVFDNCSEDQIRKEAGHRINMTELRKRNKKARFVMVQNRLDTHHYSEHFLPFWQGLGGGVKDGWSRSGKNMAFLYEDKRGHVPETEDMVTDIINKLVL